MTTMRRMPQNIDVLDSVTPFMEQSGKTTVFGGNLEVDGNLTVSGTTTSLGKYNLYRHVIKGTSQGSTAQDGDFFFAVIISSKNLKVDSLTDLKTLLGNTFQYPVTGCEMSNGIAYVYMDETGVYNEENTKSPYAKYPVTWTDTVTML